MVLESQVQMSTKSLHFLDLFDPVEAEGLILQSSSIFISFRSIFKLYVMISQTSMMCQLISY